MRISKARVDENRQKAIDAGLALFSEKGFEGVAVAELMHKAGLTHGGFYNHFDSKAELEGLALAKAFGLALDNLDRIAALEGEQREAALRRYVTRYLSPEARAASGARCPMVAFAADVRRESADVQERYGEGLCGYIDRLAASMGEADATARRTAAIDLLSSLVGALTLARSVARTNLALSDEILATVRSRVLGLKARAEAIT